MPQTIGMVRQPYLLSPGRSSISLIASRTNEIINAKPAYKNARRKKRACPVPLVPMASAKESFEKKMISIVHAVNKEITIFPISRLFLKLVEYNQSKATQPAFATTRYHF